jgi:hypothetical protein
MSSLIQKAAKAVTNYAEKVGKKIVDDATIGYQSPLELNGAVMRSISNQFKYYKPSYPYVRAYSDSLLRVNDNYVSASGWVPKTYDVKNVAIDLENEILNNKNIFDIQN